MEVEAHSLDLVFKFLEWSLRVLTVLVIPVSYKAIRLFFQILRNQDLLDQRVCVLEKSLEKLPGEKEVNLLSVAIAELRGEVSTIGRVMERMERVVARHEDYLMSGGGKR